LISEVKNGQHTRSIVDDILQNLFPDNNGKKAQALLTAPNPDRRPRMMVPSTINRDKIEVNKLGEGSAEGNGMYDSASR
jgi:hypothetical protein